MRLFTAILASGAVLFAMSAIQATPAAAAQAISPNEPALHSELSAQKRKVHRGTRQRNWQRNAGYQTYWGDPARSPYYLRPGVAPSFGYVGPPGYAGEYAWRRSLGQCVEDLGYGRWAACGSR